MKCRVHAGARGVCHASKTLVIWLCWICACLKGRSRGAARADKAQAFSSLDEARRLAKRVAMCIVNTQRALRASVRQFGGDCDSIHMATVGNVQRAQRVPTRAHVSTHVYMYTTASLVVA